MSTGTTTALTVTQRAVVALGYNEETRKNLTTLAGESAHIVAITNDDGYKQVHAARMALKNTRVEIEKRGKAAREDATSFSKAVIAEEKLLIAIISPEEERLAKLQKEHDDKIEAERQAKILAEEQRAARIRERIEELRGCANLTPANGSKLIGEHIEDLEKLIVDDSFEDSRQQAEDAKAGGLARLRQLHAAALAHEQEQVRIAAERAELARLRAEQEARDRADRERRAAEEAELQKKRDAEATAERERIRKEREAFEAEQAAARARQKAEEDRIAAERRALEEQQRAQREAEERAEADRLAKLAPAQPESVAAVIAGAESMERDVSPRVAASRPSLEDMTTVLAFHYGVDEGTVLNWLDSAVRGTRRAA
jgi:hypothetical protein